MANTKIRSDLNIYCVEITTTQHCNFRCNYCFENTTEINCSQNLEKDFDLLVKRLNEILESEWFNEEFDSLELCFWGGEPTINYKMIKKILDIYADNPMVNFFMYSNGAFPKRLLNFINSFEGLEHAHPKIKKWRFQVSYDGNPIHDLCRKTVSGKPSSEIVRGTIKTLVDNGHQVVAKGTCPTEYLKYLPNCWTDMVNLYNEHNGQVGYAVTVDYHGDITPEQMKEAEKALLKVARFEKTFHRVHNKFLSNIFSTNRQFCSSGRNMVCIDVDGEAYFCHGAMYNDCKEMHYTSIYDDNFLEKLKEKYEIIPVPEESGDCVDCIATMCLRCNVMKYVYSKKDSLLERFNDWTCQPAQCEYYKMVGRITTALFQILEEDKQNAMRMQ